jgi:molybdopterin converting factor small subunit
MKVRCLLFGEAKALYARQLHRSGQSPPGTPAPDFIDLGDLPHGVTSVDVFSAVREKFGANNSEDIRQFLECCMLAVNCEYAYPEAPILITEGSEVALIPPVSGG